jgi:hypothetical protein
MKDLPLEVRSPAHIIGAVPPDRSAEIENLTASIEREVQRQTGGAIRHLCVEINRYGVVMRGRCDTYYSKQLAQHAVMAIGSGQQLTNAIEVS